jgi:hypothetical protein
MSAPPPPSRHVRTVQVLRNKKIRIAPILLAAVFTVVMATVYFASVVNPTGHMHGLPVMIVDQDTGSSRSAGRRPGDGQRRATTSALAARLRVVHAPAATAVTPVA